MCLFKAEIFLACSVAVWFGASLCASFARAFVFHLLHRFVCLLYLVGPCDLD